MLNKKGEFMPWLVGIVIAIIGIGILWSVVSAATNPVITQYSNYTCDDGFDETIETNDTNFNTSINLSTTPVCDVTSVEELGVLDPSAYTWNNYSIKIVNETYINYSLQVYYNVTTDHPYNLTTYEDGYISNTLTRIVVGFIVAIFALGVIAFIALKKD